ncbi:MULTISPECIES: DUF1385 domain-containing protein [unclassified Fusibacter]|uniref:DUF1385 domain-containing protein n=1 Tax=unclassified Fusibacter TaxID=2624464 RepID=UPI001012D8A6|nr:MULTISPECIES: DUF1385 domain-containing protein [unclassified Fusibacter]MCK8059879.1 DUF1385 domain-containing protein [Fusibacter sp. A2]NPE21681.1 DUF1385 domain-containing protein [Fusibacter sp. A1]RXV62084.1 DUF1385 domain-containing protein [Fusibacter sp. A1]
MKEKYCDIGGQALIEGVMMRGKKTIAMSVRKTNGEIETKLDQTSQFFNHALFKLPIIRGMVALINSMIIGVQALTYSAEFFAEADDGYEESKFDLWVKKTFKDQADNVLIGFSMIMAFGMAIIMFAVIPSVIAGFLKVKIANVMALALVEGLIKITLFVGYILLISRMKDIQRVFEYHGAEHKTIHCFESGEELTPENAQKFSRIHPRCGTSFLLFVLAISIGVFSFVTWSSIGMRIVLKILLLPAIAGLAFELIKISGKYDNFLVKFISQPGLWMQRITTREPDLKQLEVAIASMEAVLVEEGVKACKF